MVRVNYHARNLVNICIDSIEDKNGRVYVRGFAEPMPFSGIGEMVITLDSFYDGVNYPQASMRLRSFTDKPDKHKQMIEVSIMSDAQEMDLDVSVHKGKVATFIVQVQYRQNATWQGNVIWAEKNVSRSFRSAIELLKLIDGSLDESPVGRDIPDGNDETET